jgi:hypothetical protein
MFQVMYNDGTQATFEAADWGIQDGALVFCDDDGSPVAAVACGEWVDVSVADDEE